MRDVFQAPHLTEAHLAQALLEAEGILAGIRGGAHHATRGEVGGIPGQLPVVYVLDEGDFDRARALLAAAREPMTGDPWTCGCGESHEPQFQACWKCGQAKLQA